MSLHYQHQGQCEAMRAWQCVVECVRAFAAHQINEGRLVGNVVRLTEPWDLGFLEYTDASSFLPASSPPCDVLASLLVPPGKKDVQLDCVDCPELPCSVHLERGGDALRLRHLHATELRTLVLHAPSIRFRLTSTPPVGLMASVPRVGLSIPAALFGGPGDRFYQLTITNNEDLSILVFDGNSCLCGVLLDGALASRAL